LDKKIVLTLSSIASAALLTSLWVTTAQSFPPSGGLWIIPTDWHQTSSSLILNESWSWDWTHGGPVPWQEGIILYKKTGDALFFTPYPPPIPGAGMPMLIANRVEGMTWGWRGGETVVGGPNMAHLMLLNGTITVAFTLDDIPLTDDDNDYRGLRLVVEQWIDLYELEDMSADQYVWHGLAHVHTIFWAPKGRRA